MIKVYIQHDEKNRVTNINSEIFIQDLTDWIEIDEGDGDKYAHAQGSYLEMPLIADDGTHNYMYDDSIRLATEDEHEVERSEFPPEEPTEDDALREMTIDHEFRIMCLELGLDASDFE